MKQVFFTLFFISFLTPVFSQFGILSGTVSDAETGDPMVGATVSIIGTYKGAFTDNAGKFRISGVKPGDYTVKFSFVGYSEKQYNGVSIAAGATKTLRVELSSTVTTLGEVEIVGERGLVDLESGQSSTKITAADLGEMSVSNVKDIVAMQVGVQENPDGIQIRGGRVYETEYVVDGISAQDPLAGTGFGVEVTSNAVEQLEVITGGAGAEYGGGSSGVIITRIKEGGKKFSINGAYRRDNLGNPHGNSSWNTDEAEISMGGPLIRNKLSFFLSGSMHMDDTFFGAQAKQLHSSLFKNDSLWAPRQNNSWSNTLKLAYNIRPGLKLTLTNQHSININQSTRSLQIVGNDAVVRPGFQFSHSLNLDNANTYTHRSNLSVLNLKGILSKQWSFNVNVGRLFVNLRADANGRPFRTETIDQILDPASIVTNPVSVFNPNAPVVYVFPGPGLFNNGGIATRWHDHYVKENTLKTKFTFVSRNKVHYLSFGQEHVEQEYQWIDVTQPWVGAPIQVNDSVTTPSTRLGRTSDFWKVSPAEGGIFFSDEIKYRGIIATLGARLNYWAPGKFVDESIDNPTSPILATVREAYKEESFGLFGRRWKARLLPRLRVSFPVTDNNVLYFNYSHEMKIAHPRFVYAGLDPVFQDRSVLANLGNPNILPEVSVSYEVGLKTQLNKDLALTVTAFNIDKYDYIIRQGIDIRIGGRLAERRIFAINQDYARIRGLEVGLSQRIGSWFKGNISGSYQIATGKSNSAAESALQVVRQGFVNTTKEQFLAWDRPYDLKLLMIFTPDSTTTLGRIPLRGFRLTLTSTLKSGLRYTPYRLLRINESTGRPEYERIDTQPFAKVGAPWFWTNIKLSRDLFIGKRGRASLNFEIRNATNYKSSAVVNGVTGRAYEAGDPLPLDFRDPLYPDPQDRGLPPDNPARYLAPRQMLFGLEFGF